MNYQAFRVNLPLFYANHKSNQDPSCPLPATKKASSSENSPLSFLSPLFNGSERAYFQIYNFSGQFAVCINAARHVDALWLALGFS